MAKAKLITGRFDDADDVQRALDAVVAAGFQRHEYGTFYVGPPGQHDIFPIGGDSYRDAATEESAGGAAGGAALGGAAGLAVGAAVAAAALPVAAIAAVLAATGVGAYVGSLMGAMSQTRHADPAESTRKHPVEQSGGVRIAVNVNREGTEARAIEALQKAGAHDISHAEGEWHDRQWTDFDPRTPPADPAR